MQDHKHNQGRERGKHSDTPTSTSTSTAVAAPGSGVSRPERKIAIVGFTASRLAAPWGQPDWEIWICNNLWKFAPAGWHRLYDLHDTDTITSDTEHTAFLAGQVCKHMDGSEVHIGDRPVAVWQPRPDWPTSRAFPKDYATEAFGRYFTNSISWMIAHALLENVTELHVYGVDMATGTEYAAQRPSCEYMLGVAAGMGVNVYIPPESDLLKVAAMYGAEDDSPLFAKIRERQKELRERMGQVQAAKHNAMIQEAQLQGAIETTDYFGAVWTNPRASRDGAPKGLEDGKTNLAAVGETPAVAAEPVAEAA